MGDWFAQRIIETGRLPLFCFFAAFIVSFVATRVHVRLIRARARWWWFKNVNIGDVHVHHVVFGVVLMLFGGVSGLVVSGVSEGWYAVTASVFGWAPRWSSTSSR